MQFTPTLFNPSLHSGHIQALTYLLHEAYAPLAAMGLRYSATHQPAERTLERLCKGEGWILFDDQRPIGTVTLYAPNPLSSCEWYRRPEVHHFGQFAIAPELQKSGLGRSLLDFLEERALRAGALEMALDTSEHAHHLIAYYARRGYRFVQHVQWEDVNYRSVILSKVLAH